MTSTPTKAPYYRNPFMLALGATVVACVLLRLKYFMIESMWPDEALYAWYGVKLSSDPSFLFTKQLWEYHPPLFTVLVAVFDLALDYDVALRAVAPAFAVAGVVLIYLFGKELRSEFVGLCAAILLCFNHLFWFIGNRILLDVPLTTLCLAVAYAVVRYEKHRRAQRLVLSLILLSCAVMMKTEGVVMVAFTALFALRLYGRGIVRRFGALRSIVLVLVVVAASLVLLSRLNLHGTFRISSKNLASASKLDFAYLLTWPVLVLFLLGLTFAVIRRTSAHWVLFLYVVAILVPKIFVGHTLVPRYMLPALPGMLVLAAMGAEDVLATIRGWGLKVNQWVFVVAVCLLAIPGYTKGDELHVNRQIGYTGFAEAGEVLKDADADLVYAMSMRTMRYFSNIEFEEFGGKLRPFPENREEFRRAVRDRSAVIELDIFEYSAPAYVYPLTQEKVRFFGAQGFRLKKKIERPVPGRNGMHNTGVIYVFEKE
jgi:4-amino-4-deoxy-L-arabinose transferase-like glycosyltransferase